MKISQYRWRWINGRAVSAVLSFLLSSLALNAQTTTYYADSSLGNNGYDGLLNVVAEGHGPKLYVTSAISAASSGDAIQVAAGVYQ